MSNSEDSITAWVEALRHNNEDAARMLWERYFDKLVSLARRNLKITSGRAGFDEEDIALSVFDVLCRTVQDDRYQQMNSREDLWQILVVMTIRKTQQHTERAMAQKRGGDQVVGEGGLDERGMDGFASHDSPPLRAVRPAIAR